MNEKLFLYSGFDISFLVSAFTTNWIFLKIMMEITYLLEQLVSCICFVGFINKKMGIMLYENYFQ